jgi:hypothetical protein
MDDHKTHIHLFEEAGLGIAPFEFVGEYDRGRNHTTCDYCGTGIRYEQIIKDSKGNHFKVGNECVRKTGDKGLISLMQLELKKRRLKAAEEKRKRMAEEFEAQLAQQREKNGGLTDWELAQKAKAEREAKEKAAQRKAALRLNRKILEIWSPVAEDHRRYTLRIIQEFGGTYEPSQDQPYGSSGFMADMWANLQTRPYTELSMRQREVLARAIAKGLMRLHRKRKIDAFLAECEKALGI